MDEKKPGEHSRLMNSRPLALIALCFGAGLALGKELQGSGLWIFAALAAFFAAVALLIKYNRAAIISAALLIGLLRITAAYPSLPPPGDYRLSGRVLDIPRYEYGAWDIILGGAKIDGSRASGHVKLTFYDPYRKNEFSAGDIIEVQASVSLPKGAMNEGALDIRHYLLGKGVSMKAASSRLLSRTESKPDLHTLNLNVRNAICSNIETLFPKNAELMKGILLGFEDEMAEETLVRFRDTGLSHILSVSGLHVGFFTAVLNFLLKRTNVRVRFAIIGIFLLFYCAVTVFPESLIRASVMSLLMLAAGIFGRRNDPLTSLSAAFILILIINPFQLFAAGFQLSFAAVAGILMLYKPTCLLLRGLFAPLRESLAVTASATLGTLPFTLSSFNRLPVYGVIANLFAVPISSLAVIPGFIAIIICFAFPTAAAPLAAFSDLMLELMMFAVNIISRAPYSILKLPSPSFVQCAGFAVLMLFLSPFVLIKPKLKRISAVLLAALCAAFVIIPVLTQPECSVAVLEAKGCAPIHVRIGNRNYIPDLGGTEGSYALSRMLDHRGVTAIDGALVTTLSDAKAVYELSKQFRIRTVYVFEQSENIRLILEASAEKVLAVERSETVAAEKDLAFSFGEGLIIRYKNFVLCTKQAPGQAAVRVISSERDIFENKAVAVLAGGFQGFAESLKDTKVFSTAHQGEITFDIKGETVSISTFI